MGGMRKRKAWMSRHNTKRKTHLKLDECCLLGISRVGEMLGKGVVAFDSKELNSIAIFSGVMWKGQLPSGSDVIFARP